MVTREQLLAKIKELIDGNPFLNSSLYTKFQEQDDQRLKKVLAMLVITEEQRQSLGEGADDKIVEMYRKVESDFQEKLKHEMTEFLHNAEDQDHAKDEKIADKLLDSL